MKNMSDASYAFMKMTQELAEHQREAVALIAEQLAGQQLTDKSAIEAVLASQLPDTDDMARQILADCALDAIVQEAVIQPLARCALAALIDDCVRDTFAQTDFVEVLSDNLQKSIAHANMPSSLVQHLQAPSVETDIQAVAAKYLNEAAVEGEFVDFIEERIKSLTSLPLLTLLLFEQFAELAATADFSYLLAERVKAIVNESDYMSLFNRQMKELTLPKDFAARLHEEGSELNAQFRELADSIYRAVRMESFRLMPYDQFLDRTAGSLPDFTLDRDQLDYAKISEEIE